ncbi:hypothetical protein HN876_02160 [archaeon]|jgi:hypothetical protein|nr:hypothetical protein [archaeon]MBT6606053.1 hypothetical protein [archaeon]MBT7251696.1 hypothetical protein [archaeon]
MKRIILKKRGQIFSLIAVAIVALLFLTFQANNLVQERYTVKTRISTMEGYLHSLENNLERQIFISGFRVIFLAEDEIASTGEFIGSFDDFFEEAFNNGTVNGIEKEIMAGATKDDLINSINEKANKINIHVTFSNVSTVAFQEDPWFTTFVFSFNLTVEDLSGLAKWDRFQVIEARVPIEGFEDPLFLVNTNAMISRRFNQSIYSFGNETAFDVGDFESHVAGGYYFNNPSAPSFLNRLEGNLSSNDQGIESFVIISDLIGQGIPSSTKSMTDHIYFSSNNPSHFGVVGMSSWFRIDDESNRLNYYGINDTFI